MAAFIPGNLLLCEDCRTACARVAKKVRTETKSHHEDKSVTVKKAQEKREATDAGRKSQDRHDGDLHGAPDGTARP